MFFPRYYFINCFCFITVCYIIQYILLKYSSFYLISRCIKFLKPSHITLDQSRRRTALHIRNDKNASKINILLSHICHYTIWNVLSVLRNFIVNNKDINTRVVRGWLMKWETRTGMKAGKQFRGGMSLKLYPHVSLHCSVNTVFVFSLAFRGVKHSIVLTPLRLFLGPKFLSFLKNLKPVTQCIR